MCGRYALAYDSENLSKQIGTFNLEINTVDETDNGGHTDAYNIAPTQEGAVYRNEGDTMGKLSYMKWGLIPHWTKDVTKFKSYSTFNARVESLLESKIWKGCCNKKRCVVPISGYYEWKTNGKGKTPYYITRKDGKLMFLAGLYDHVQSVDMHTYSIVTNDAPKELRWLHPRMPVVLEPHTKAWDAWLNNGKIQWTQEELQETLESKFNPETILCYQVSADVGKVANQGSRLTKPILMKDKNALIKQEPIVKAEIKSEIKSEDIPIKPEESPVKKEEIVQPETPKVKKRSIIDLLGSSSAKKRHK
ncbi:hypothetical protein Kpol_1018p154 [Vanderwaltozyma polyspora DSM 70294]|uniref:Abasic site processing protein n=1 Tax=Vanderwaltozyma polyspora (strain ATCC 22028 / DSM 70294 / BCRC 21397 / CBS 2163 / NBRC 10782 / NRRL Y-8283 / UCD 57-17) TaxID=436907 RepID=A7TDZ5_VANPO|nr:uncharacterized protein Kpol_1018p154 [Vanderwaltozyma polyspora DSM 70294]EDO19615.1 hypothetical protein Kpol_1018p154 [Vanderwaltozyma polyspora DSM 70294]